MGSFFRGFGIGVVVTASLLGGTAYVFRGVLPMILGAPKPQIPKDVAAEATTFQRQVSRAQADEALADLKKAGMQVTEFSATEQAKLREKFKPVIEKHGAAIAATVADLQAELAKIRK